MGLNKVNDETVLFDSYMEPKQVQPLWVSEPGSNGNEGVLHIPKTQILEPYHQMVLCHILQHQPIGLQKKNHCFISLSSLFQSCYYVHFRANTLGKGMSPLILPAMG